MLDEIERENRADDDGDDGAAVISREATPASACEGDCEDTQKKKKRESE